MQKVKVISWNVNSIRMRVSLVNELLAQEDPDFLFLQETKALEEQFPVFDGYYLYTSSEKGKNGVAILSKHECMPYDFGYLGRLVSVKWNNTVFSSLYMYNGFSLLSPKEKKMEMYQWMAEKVKDIDSLVLGGDFNIFYKNNETTQGNPYETDEISVFKYFEQQMEDSTPNEQFITWWDYRENAFYKNLGYGLDKFFFKGVPDYGKPIVMRDFRRKIKPSDHAPVKILFNL